MCKAIEDMLIEAAKQAAWQTAAEIAVRLSSQGIYTLEEIADITGLTLEEVRELSKEVQTPV